MKAKTFLDQEKVAEKTGLGGSGSHWILTQLFGKPMEHAAHRLTSTYGKVGKHDGVGKPHSLHPIFYSWVSEDFVPASSLRTLLPS